MALFDKLAKRVTAGMGKAAFEGEKLLRVNEIKGRVSSLKKELSEQQGTLAALVIEVYRAGKLEIPELQEPIQGILGLEERIAETEQELAAKQAEQFEGAEGEVEEGTCAQCGAEVPEDGAFCANCGAKIG